MSRILGKLLILATLCGWGYAAEANGRQLTVFAAASTKGPMDEMAALAKNNGMEITMVYAGSSLLARQIENGSPADVFVSAHPLWTERLKKLSIIDPESISTIASNRLVLIAGKKVFEKNKIAAAISPKDAIQKYLDSEFLAVADPDHVPAGMYAKEALTNIGLWDNLKNSLARTLDVTAALVLVANGEAPLGIVYASDVITNDAITNGGAVVVISQFNANDHAPIVYSAGAIKQNDSTNSKAAMEFINILKSNAGKNAFIKYGFRGN